MTIGKQFPMPPIPDVAFKAYEGLVQGLAAVAQKISSKISEAFSGLRQGISEWSEWYKQRIDYKLEKFIRDEISTDPIFKKKERSPNDVTDEQKKLLDRINELMNSKLITTTQKFALGQMRSYLLRDEPSTNPADAEVVRRKHLLSEMQNLLNQLGPQPNFKSTFSHKNALEQAKIRDELTNELESTCSKIRKTYPELKSATARALPLNREEVIICNILESTIVPVRDKELVRFIQLHLQNSNISTKEWEKLYKLLVKVHKAYNLLDPRELLLKFAAEVAFLPPAEDDATNCFIPTMKVTIQNIIRNNERTFDMRYIDALNKILFHATNNAITAEQAGKINKLLRDLVPFLPTQMRREESSSSSSPSRKGRPVVYVIMGR